MNVQIKKLNENAKVPFYATPYSAGCDLYACIEEEITIEKGQTKLIPTGLAMAIPEGYVGLIYARSSLACKQGLAPANKVGVIDADYRGEIMVALYNQSDKEQTIEPKERIAQIAFLPYVQGDFEVSDELNDTDRGNGGFGSTN